MKMTVGCDIAPPWSEDHSCYCLAWSFRGRVRYLGYWSSVPWWLYLLGRLRLVTFVVEQ